MRRFVAAGICAALVAIAVPSLANAQAGDMYGNPLPSSGGGNGTSSSGSSGTVIPVAPSSGSTTTTPTTDTGSASTDTSGGSASKQGSHQKQQSNKKNANTNGNGNGGKAKVTESQPTSAHTVPQIAADSAGDSWVPFFIAGLVALGSAFAFAVVLRNRRRRAAS